MEAGYDYLLLRGRLQRKVFRYVGIFLFVFGAVLLATGGAYYGYAAKARADLGDLNVNVPGPVKGQFQDQASGNPSDLLDALGMNGLINDGQSNGRQVTPDLAKVLPRMSAAEIGIRRLYPGESLLASSWSNPWTFEPASYREQILLRGFIPIEFGTSVPEGGLVPATRLIVPAIGIDSTIKELKILELEDSRAYETPNKVVGHIPETANAGESGSSWFFGHTESPTLGEGSVFFDLQKIPGKLRNGEDVFIITDNGTQQYLYRATSSQVLNQNDLTLYETGQATIHLVSCVPRLVYDHRLIVTGELIARKSTS